MARLLAVVRLSKVTEESVSIADQKKKIKSYAATFGHQIVGYAEDPGVSGDVSPFDREQLRRWLTDEHAGEYDGIIAAKIDRVSRRLVHFVTLLGWAKDRGKMIVSVDDHIDTSTP